MLENYFSQLFIAFWQKFSFFCVLGAKVTKKVILSRHAAKSKQMVLTGNAVDDNAPIKMDTALAVLTHSLGLIFDFASNPLMVRVLDVACVLPVKDIPPSACKCIQSGWTAVG